MSIMDLFFFFFSSQQPFWHEMVGRQMLAMKLIKVVKEFADAAVVRVGSAPVNGTGP